MFMDLYSFFWKYPEDPYAIYDFSGDRYWTGGNEKIERMLVVEKWLSFR